MLSCFFPTLYSALRLLKEFHKLPVITISITILHWVCPVIVMCRYLAQWLKRRKLGWFQTKFDVMTNARPLDATVAADYVNRFTVGYS